MIDIRIESSYVPEQGYRIVWSARDEKDEKVVFVEKYELERLSYSLSHPPDQIDLEDGASSIMVNSDTTEFFITDQKPLEVPTTTLKEKIDAFLGGNRSQAKYPNY